MADVIPSSRDYVSEWESICESAIIGVDRFSTQRTAVTETGSPTRSIREIGSVFTFSGSNICRALLTNGIPANKQASLLAVCRTTTTTTSQWICGFGSESGGSGNTLFALLTGGTTASGLHLHAGGANANISGGTGFDTSAFGFNNGKWHTVLMTVDLTNFAVRARVFADGALVGSYTGTDNVGTLTYTSVCAGGTRRGATNLLGFVGDIALVQPIYRFLSDAEAISLTQDPWQLFEAESATFAQKLASSAGSSITLSPSGNVTASSTVALQRSKVFVPTGSVAVDSGASLLKEKVLVPSGQVSLSQSAALIKTKLLVPSGQVTVAGSASLIPSDGTLLYTLSPSGQVTLSQSSALIRSKVLAPNGNVSISGNAGLVFSRSLSFIEPSGNVTVSGSAPMSSPNIPIGSGGVTSTTRRKHVMSTKSK